MHNRKYQFTTMHGIAQISIPERLELGDVDDIDDLWRMIRAQMVRRIAPICETAYASDNKSPCSTCNGVGEVGGLLPDGGGYWNDPCPECANTPPASTGEG